MKVKYFDIYSSFVSIYFSSNFYFLFQLNLQVIKTKRKIYQNIANFLKHYTVLSELLKITETPFRKHFMHVHLYIEVIKIILFQTIFSLCLEKYKHHKVLKLLTLSVIKLQIESKR